MIGRCDQCQQPLVSGQEVVLRVPIAPAQGEVIGQAEARLVCSTACAAAAAAGESPAFAE